MFRLRRLGHHQVGYTCRRIYINNAIQVTTIKIVQYGVIYSNTKTIIGVNLSGGTYLVYSNWGYVSSCQWQVDGGRGSQRIAPLAVCVCGHHGLHCVASIYSFSDMCNQPDDGQI